MKGVGIINSLLLLNSKFKRSPRVVFLKPGKKVGFNGGDSGQGILLFKTKALLIKL
jgi:hypothetical protein